MPVKYGITEEWQTRISSKTRRRPSSRTRKKRRTNGCRFQVGNRVFIDFRSLQIRGHITLQFNSLARGYRLSGNIWHPTLPLLFQVDTKPGRLLSGFFTIFAASVPDFGGLLSLEIWFGQVGPKGIHGAGCDDLTVFERLVLLEEA